MNKLLTTLLACASACVAPPSPAADIDLMTQNQYLGADLAPVLDAAMAGSFDPDRFSAAVVTALQQIAKNRPGERARALAEQIARRGPDVVSLQEAYAFACTPYPGYPTQPGMGCDDPLIKGAFSDHLADTAAALRHRYTVVGRITLLRIDALPFTVNGYPAVLALADRDAILVRHGLPAQAVDFAATTGCRQSEQGCYYRTAPPVLATPLGPIAIERGFLAADVTVRGTAYRVFNTHLEQRLLAASLPQTRLLQVGQAYELLGTALGTWDGVKKVIVTGDINSDPADTIPVPPYPPTLPGAPELAVLPPYQVLASLFTDVWLLQRHPGEGFSCCQQEDLRNRRSQLYERIDMIFSLTRPTSVSRVELLGDGPSDKLHGPGWLSLWPSDHAALAARLHFD